MHSHISFVLTLLLTFWASGALGASNGDLSGLIESEKNTIKIFQDNVNSVVNVATIQQRRGGWFYGDYEMPAGAGTGIVWDEAGHILTNFHVVQNGNKFQISFHNDKNQYEATVVGVEPKKDVAVLKLVKRPPKLTPIRLGSSQYLQVGQKAVAIGNPFGLDHTVTQGIVSALDRKIEGIGGVNIHGMIQTDASINPGNSGGPLLDSSGLLIGMNTVIFSASGTSAGVGFAVPIDAILRVVPQLIKFGKVIRPGLGIGVLPENMRERFGISKGIIITYIDENGAAAKAGLVGMGQDEFGRYYLGDVVLEIDGKEVNNYDDIFHILDQMKIGDEVTIKYVREGKTKTVKVKLSAI
ncbi:MAG: trypsin-like peptidase domain-containing protein [Bdellovibrio sp.]|nr:trypsin-like peptidase domain-containing protein [Bdellovibrio sp.]